ncbi:MAG: DUF4012 domain-containing protein, partial [Sideroxyarcus sp.]|nr:DUF4012 domain-containing protein [Sideroxyarcus sp.]
MSIHISKKRLHRAQSPNLLDLRNPVQQSKNAEHPAVAPRHAHERPHRRVAFHFPRPRLRLHSVALRGLIQFVVVAVLIIVPILAGFAVAKINAIREDVLQKTSDAYADLMDAKDNVLSLKFTDAERSFSDAENAFSDALALLPVSERTLTVLAALPTGDFVENAYHTLVAGRTLSHAGAAAAKILAPAGADGVQFSAGSFPTVTVSEQLVAPEWQAVQEDVQAGLTHLEKINSEALPQKYREQFSVLFDHLPLLLTAVQNVDNVQDMLRYFLGFDGRKEYIVWFQNTSELRATGGFIGSFAVLAAENGTLSVIDVPGKGAYTLNDYITKKIVPPAPLQLINKDWQSQDANWWPDFPTSAEKFNEFYTLARGFPVDGIIALTPKLITDLLGITGDVALDTYGIHVNAENFLSITQE